jgi:membrane-associated phospholipid phosphatase
MRTLAVCAVALLAMPLAAAASGLSVDYVAFAGIGWLGLCFAPVVACLRWRGMGRIAAAIECVVLAIVMTLPILILSYAAMRLGQPLADARLASWDALVGLDAGTMVAAIGRWPLLSALLGTAYASFSIQIVALPAILALAGQGDRGYWFIACFVLICVAAIAIAAGFPAVGSYVHFGLEAGALGSVNPFFGYHFLDSFHAVRDDPAFVLSTDVVSGIVTFPSIHAAVAVLCAVAAWPLRAVRAPMLLLNLAMFVAAVTHGAHYVVDIIAGGVLAAVVIRLLGAVEPTAPRGVIPIGPAAPAAAASAH